VWNDVLHDIRQKIRYRQYSCPISSVFNTHLSVFVSENIRIRIRIYPYSNSNSNKNMKTNMISVISVRIRSDYIPTLLYSSLHKDAKRTVVACAFLWIYSLINIELSELSNCILFSTISHILG
jgi:hypothetical protein